MEAVFPNVLEDMLGRGLDYLTDLEQKEEEQKQIFQKQNKQRWSQFFEKVEALIPVQLHPFIDRGSEARTFSKPRFITIQVPRCAPMRVELLNGGDEWKIRNNQVEVAAYEDVDDDEGIRYLCFTQIKVWPSFHAALADAHLRYQDMRAREQFYTPPAPEPAYTPIDEIPQPGVSDLFSRDVLDDLGDMMRDIARDVAVDVVRQTVS